jgi:hypothetical protein
MKKHHWHVFWHEKLFEKHPQPHCQISSYYSYVEHKLHITNQKFIFYYFY